MTNAGFTLLETVIVVALGVCVLVALGALFFNINSVMLHQQAITGSSGSASAVMREVETFVLPAQAVLASHTFSGGTYVSSSTSLVLQIPSIDPSGYTIANTYDYVAFYVSGTAAYRALEPSALSSRMGGIKRLSATVDTLTFTYNSANVASSTVVTTDIQTRVSVKGQTFSDRRRAAFELRNH